MTILYNTLSVAPGISLFHTGPALDHGPLPAVFYFSLSGPDSLTLDPYNQPVQFLQGQMIRVFSMTLPGHENGLPPTGAMALWAEDLRKGRNCIEIFLAEAERAVEFAVHNHFIDPNKLAVAGLSRGAFVAAHLAARDARFRYLLGFAPLTRLGTIKEFAHLQKNPLIESLNLTRIAETLSDRHVRLYIGNHDTRVGTRDCFEFAMALVDQKKTRTVQAEFFMTPSLGAGGHGTSPAIFKQGADWLSLSLQKGSFE